MNMLYKFGVAPLAALLPVVASANFAASAEASHNPQYPAVPTATMGSKTAGLTQRSQLGKRAYSSAQSPAVVDPLPPYERLSKYSLPADYMDSFKKIDITRRFNGGKHFIGTLLRKPGGVEVHEQWLNPESRELLVQVRLGDSAVGHPGIVHGGATATILDNAFGMLFFSCNLGTGFTANLNLDYRAPLPAGTDVVAHLSVVGIQGSKVHMRAVLFDPATGTVHAQARCLFIAKHVASSAKAVGALQRYLSEGLASGAKVVTEAPGGAREAELAAAAGK